MSQNPNKIEVERTNRLVGRNLRRIRTNQRIKQTEIAAEVGVQSPQIHKIESGRQRISAGMLFKVASYLKTDVSEFYRPEPEALHE